MSFGKKQEEKASSGLRTELDEQRSLRFKREQEIDKYKLAIKELTLQNQVLQERLKNLSIFSILAPIVSPVLNSKNSSSETIEAINLVLTRNLQSLLPRLHSLPN
jgi:hypothetical protein